MSAPRRRLAAVAADAAPPLSPVTLERAAQAHPFNCEHQRRWLASVKTLRESIQRGWIADNRQYRLKDPIA